MSFKIEVSLDDDVLEVVNGVSKSIGMSFDDALNHLLHSAMAQRAQVPKREFNLRTTRMAPFPHLNYDDIEGLIEYGEGPFHR